MVVTLIPKLKQKESMWYPACGMDFRPVHHVAFNNFYISPSILLFNDIEGTFDPDRINSIEGCEVIAYNDISYREIKIRCAKIRVKYREKVSIKDLFFFKLSNKQMFEFLFKHKITPTTLLLHALKDEFTPMEESWVNVMKRLGIEYCYTDNWFHLTLNGASTFRKEIMTNELRFISKQSYTGFDMKKIGDASFTLAINNGFDSTVYLFQLTSNRIGTSGKGSSKTK